jgi:hypothetical protein
MKLKFDANLEYQLDAIQAVTIFLKDQHRRLKDWRENYSK